MKYLIQTVVMKSSALFRITFFYLLFVMGYMVEPSASGAHAEQLVVQADVANIRKCSTMNAAVLCRLPIGTRVYGDYVDSTWFHVDSVKHYTQRTIRLSGFAHKSTLASKLLFDHPSLSELEKIVKDKNYNTSECVTLFERAHALQPNDSLIARRLERLYVQTKRPERASSIDSLLAGLNPIILAVPLLSGRTVVLGKLYPDGKLDSFVHFETSRDYQNVSAGTRLQLSGIRWHPVVRSQGYGSTWYSMIFPKPSIGTFGKQVEQDGGIVWIELTQTHFEADGVSRCKLNPSLVFGSRACKTVGVVSQLPFFRVAENRSRVDSLYQWHATNPCTKEENPARVLRALDVSLIPGTELYDMGFTFNDYIGNLSGMQRAIVNAEFQRSFLASGRPGFWFTPCTWDEDILVSVAHFSTESKDCEASTLEEGINIIMLMPNGTVRTHTIYLGQWG